GTFHAVEADEPETPGLRPGCRPTSQGGNCFAAAITLPCRERERSSAAARTPLPLREDYHSAAICPQRRRPVRWPETDDRCRPQRGFASAASRGDRGSSP